jgi:hypothetical protein
MTIQLRARRILPFFVAATLQALWGYEGLVVAAAVKAKKDTKPSVTQTVAPTREIASQPAPRRRKAPVKNEAEPRLVPDSRGTHAPVATGRKGRRHSRANKKLTPQAVVQAKPDLSYLGLLRQPQRYDPGWDQRTGGAPNPQVGDLLHEHFQELDKNRDGMIDPLERARGRLDIDRDLSNRQWK